MGVCVCVCVCVCESVCMCVINRNTTTAVTRLNWTTLNVAVVNWILRCVRPSLAQTVVGSLCALGVRRDWI
jgi:hypothetical protein